MPVAADAPPLTAAFAAAMAGFAPFEPAPRLAVAVSGGADSLALCLLAEQWARAQGGDVVALTVDHRLRPGSGAEAAAVGAFLAGRGIPHHVLAWAGALPGSGLQARARAARYALLGGWCRDAGVLHLLVGHHAGDQAETVLMRALGGSGSAGLAGMRRLVETGFGRILRPLLGLAAADLRHWLAAAGIRWHEDPSNQDRAFTRVRLRFAGLSLATAGLDVSRVNEVAALAEAARRSTALATADLAAATVTLAPAGYAVVDRQELAAAPSFLVRRLLAAVIATIGGRRWQPAERSVDRLAAVIAADAAVAETLGGCRLAAAAAAPTLLVVREPRNLPPPLPVPASGRLLLHWDGRFAVRLDGWQGGWQVGGAARLRLEALGAARASALARRLKETAGGGPAAVWPPLPCLVTGDGGPADVVMIPAVGYRRANDDGDGIAEARFRPRWPLSGGGHFPL